MYEVVEVLASYGYGYIIYRHNFIEDLDLLLINQDHRQH